MNQTTESAKIALKRFIDGEDRSIAAAGYLEVWLDDAFPDDPRFEDLVLALASYQPGGGALLFDGTAISRMCEHALVELNKIDS
jgi:hypothetical protein